MRSPARWLETRDSRCVATRQSASCRNTYGTSSAERAAIVGGPPAALCTPRAKYYVVLYSLISSLATTLNFQCLCLRTSAAANAHCMRAAVVGLVGAGARLSDALRRGAALDMRRPSRAPEHRFCAPNPPRRALPVSTIACDRAQSARCGAHAQPSSGW